MTHHEPEPVPLVSIQYQHTLLVVLLEKQALQRSKYIVTTLKYVYIGQCNYLSSSKALMIMVNEDT